MFRLEQASPEVIEVPDTDICGVCGSWLQTEFKQVRKCSHYTEFQTSELAPSIPHAQNITYYDILHMVPCGPLCHALICTHKYSLLYFDDSNPKQILYCLKNNKEKINSSHMSTK